MEEIKILEIDDTSFESQSLIQFSSLIKFLFKLNSKQKSLEQKINILNNSINEKENRIKNLESKLEEQPKFEELKIGQSFMSTPNITQNIIKSEKFDSSPNEIIKQSIDNEDKKEKEKQNLNITLNDIKKEEKERYKENDKDEKYENKKQENEYEKEREKDKENYKKKEEEKKEYKEKENNGDIKNIENKEHKKIENIKEKKDSSEIGSSININPDMIKNLFKKSKEFEKRIIDLTKKSDEHLEMNENIKKDNELINSNSQKILELENSINDILFKFSEHKKEFKDLKIKVQDFNILDLVKSSGDNNSGNIDLSKALIMNLESKIFKKFDLYDERNKSLDTDIFQLKENNKTLKNENNNIKYQHQKILEEIKTIKESNTNQSELNNELNNKINQLESELNDIQNKNNENLELIKNSLNEKIQKSEDDMKSLLNSEINKNQNLMNNMLKDINKAGNNNKDNIDYKEESENIKNMLKKINDINKKLFSEEKNILNIKDKIQLIEDENYKKFTKLESLLTLKDKFNLLQEELNTESLKFNTIQQSYDKTRNDISNLVHKIEYLNSELTKLSFQKITSSEKPEIVIDFSKYLEKGDFINNKKEVNNKFEKVRLAIENLGSNIENISNSLSHAVNNKEMSNYQTQLKNNFDELKSSLNKKFADKNEINKTIKVLESKVKNLVELNKNKDAADNWLLAKKPLNNYLCASCESVIKGELDKRSNFIAWNKYPSRDEKNYRMGHGFSKMLQMVNDDIMKSTNNDNINQRIFLNTNANNSNTNINSPVNTEGNILRTIFTNNSSKLSKMKNRNINILTSQNINMEAPLSYRGKNKDQHKSLAIDDQSDFKNSQIMKIYKIHKNSANSNISPDKNNSSSVKNIYRNILHNSQKKTTDNNIKTFSQF